MHKKELVLSSIHLGRKVTVTVILPPNYAFSFRYYPILYLNDGQDIPSLRMEETLYDLFSEHIVPSFIVVGLHANEQRIQEYGTARQADYAGRGSKAGHFTRFVLEELKPYLERHYRIKKQAEHHVYAGFSLGGLSALDIAWNHSDVFPKVGVFSGSLWWRSKALDQGYQEATDRIMHAIVRETIGKPNLKFWLQTGTEDEVSDRNNNGIIDSIDDTLGLIEALQLKGYRLLEDIVYREVEGGRHDQTTWGKVMGEFLVWAFGKDER